MALGSKCPAYDKTGFMSKMFVAWNQQKYIVSLYDFKFLNTGTYFWKTIYTKQK